MSFLRKSLAKMTTQTVGAGAILLIPNAGDTVSFQSVLGNGPVKARMMLRGNGYYQHFIGTFTAPLGVVRTETIKSSNSDTDVNIPSGATTDVYLLDYAQFVVDGFATNKTLTNKESSNSAVFTGASAATLTLPAISSADPDFWQFVNNRGSALLSITAPGSDRLDVNGLATVILGPGDNCWLFLDAAAGVWRVVGLASAAANNPNIAINGTMEFDQEFGGVSVAVTAAAPIKYVLDQYYASCTGANVSTQQIAGTGAYRNSLRFTGAVSNTGVLFGQRHESFECDDMKNANVTHQWELSSNALTTITWAAYSANAQDNFSAKTQIATGSFTVNATPAIYSATFNAGANARNGICIELTGGALLAAKTLDISGYKLELGSYATPLRRELRSAALDRCERHAIAFSYSNTQIAHGSSDTATAGSAILRFRKMRATPAAGILPTYGNGAGQMQFLTNVNAPPAGGGTHSVGQGCADSIAVIAAGYTGLTVGGASLLYSSSASKILLQARL